MVKAKHPLSIFPLPYRIPAYLQPVGDDWITVSVPFRQMKWMKLEKDDWKERLEDEYGWVLLEGIKTPIKYEPMDAHLLFKPVECKPVEGHRDETVVVWAKFQPDESIWIPYRVPEYCRIKEKDEERDIRPIAFSCVFDGSTQQCSVEYGSPKEFSIWAHHDYPVDSDGRFMVYDPKGKGVHGLVPYKFLNFCWSTKRTRIARPSNLIFDDELEIWRLPEDYQVKYIELYANNLFRMAM